MPSFSRRVLLGCCATVWLAMSGCAQTTVESQQPKLNPEEIEQLTEQNTLINALESFVHSNLYTGMIQVWAHDRLSWNKLLSAYACGLPDVELVLSESYQNTQPVFSEAILQLALNNTELSEEEQQILHDVSALAYRLFSASYAQGYARQVKLADELQPGIADALCGGKANKSTDALIDYAQKINWQSPSHAATRLSLQPHADHGYQAFNQLLLNQYAQFDALVYSHAYQSSETYQALFFEVNKYENVEAYAERVRQLSEEKPFPDILVGHGDFAYLVLSSGFHWGMMSLLAMLEEEFPEIHDEKKRQAKEQIKATMDELKLLPISTDENG